MTQKEIEFIGHRMLLTAEGGALTGCRWLTDASDAPGVPGDMQRLDREVIENAIREIKEYLNGERKEFDVDVKITGTGFQIKVWEELRRIPYGETITYAELALRIGNPKACRAVANACGANPLPILIPCHRVVASGGKTGGYTGGLDIKLALLEIERL